MKRDRWEVTDTKQRIGTHRLVRVTTALVLKNMRIATAGRHFISFKEKSWEQVRRDPEFCYILRDFWVKISGETQNGASSLVGRGAGSAGTLLQWTEPALEKHFIGWQGAAAAWFVNQGLPVPQWVEGFFAVRYRSQWVFLRHGACVISIHFAQERPWIASASILLYSSLQTLFLPLSSHSPGYHSFLINAGVVPQPMARRQCVSH